MRRWLTGMVFIFSVILFSISLYLLMGMYREEQKDAQTYDRIQEIYQNPENQEDDNIDKPNVEESAVQTKEADAGLLALHEENPDCVAWITIEDTVIDYPIMYRPEKENYYLHRDFYGDYSANGSLFFSELCNLTDDDNLIVYGHHMNSGKMFAALDQYKSEEFYKEHKSISLQTLQGKEEYQVIAAFTTPVYTGNDFAYYQFVKAENAVLYAVYVQNCKERSFYDTGITAGYGEKLLTLSTCEYSQQNGRMVVVAKRITGGDKTKR
ncbi:MAG: class B sortase [Clostridia bacterium]|nr:class B sortase [Clostridia bacterium]